MKTAIQARDELLSLEALLVSRTYAYMLFHKAFGGEPNGELLAHLASDATWNVLDEYAGENETLRKLAGHLRGLDAKAQDAGFLDAVHALHAKEALLYPQLAQGISAFVELEGVFLGQALAWIANAAVDAATVAEPYDSEVFFGEIKAAFELFAALDLKGLDDNKLVEK